MTRFAIRGLALLGLLAATLATARAQNADVVSVRDRKDNSIKKVSGTFTASPAGFQVVGADKKVLATVNPDDVVGIAIGDLVGVERGIINSMNTKEEKKLYAEALTGYKDAAKATGLPERTQRYLRYKIASMTQKTADEVDFDKGWKAKADDAVAGWNAFLQDYKFGWEVWPAARALTRTQAELGDFAGAARTWNRLAGNKELPPDARLEAQIQEIDFQIRAKLYSNAEPTAAELQKTANGAQKERLAIYQLTAKSGDKPLEGIDKIKAEMEKTKDASVHATGFAMMGELYLAGGKPRDAMWAFLWVETVLNQDRDEAFKAVARLTGLFEAGPLADEDQAKKYRDKLKRLRLSF